MLKVLDFEHMLFEDINILKSNASSNYNQTYSYAILTDDQVREHTTS
jgi:hypothetical protein